MKPLPQIPDHVHQYLLSLLFQLVIPLFPLGFEWWKTQDISDTSTTLVAAMYSISIGATSTSRLLAGLGIAVSVVFSVAYGALLGQSEQSHGGFPHSGGAALVCIGLIFAYNAFERFNLHICYRQPFLLFAQNPTNPPSNNVPPTNN